MTLVEFIGPSTLRRERDRPSHWPIVGNGPPGTFVVFDALRVSLPTDQIVSIDDGGGRVRVGFGGMSFVGEENGVLIFDRVRELHPEADLSPERSHQMRLERRLVAAVFEDGRLVWSPA